MANVILSPSSSSTLKVDSSATPPAKRFAIGVAPRSGCIASVVSTATAGAADENWPPPTTTGNRLASSSSEIYSVEHFRIYDLALQLYSGIRHGRLAGGLHFPNSTCRRRVYRLVFDLLYHKEIIEELLYESSFYSRNFELKEQETLVQLMVYDCQNSRFTIKLPRNGGEGDEEIENVPSIMLTIAKAICKHRVKLNAALARMRVESSVQTITHLLPEASFLKYQNILAQPFHVRINTKKVGSDGVDGIISQLCESGFSLCACEEEFGAGGRKFYQQEENLLAFSYPIKETVLQHPLLHEGYLVPQDCASYYLVSELKEILCQNNISGDVIVTHCNAGVEVAHIASLMNGDGRVIVYGALPMQMDSLDNALHLQQIDNVDFIHAPFTSADSQSSDLANVSVIICLPPSSLSTVKQPLDFILQEGDHVAPLLLSKKSHLGNSLAREQSSTLTHAITFSQCWNIVYAVRSRDDQETTTLVTKCLNQQEEPPNGDDDDGESTREYNPGPSRLTKDGGYHISCLERRPESPKPTASDIIAKAIMSGVLSGEGLSVTSDTTRTKKKRKKQPRIFSQHDGIPMTVSALNKVTPKKSLSADMNTRKPFR